MMDVLKLLRPSWWFSAHLHVRFQAEYDHTGQGISDWGRIKPTGLKAPASARKARVKNNDEIVMDGDDDELGSTVVTPKSRPRPPPNADEIIMDDDIDDETPTSKGEALTMKPPSETAEEAVRLSPDQSLIEAKPLPGEPPLDLDLLPIQESAVLDIDTSERHLPSTTKFLALDKCVPRRKFLEVDT
jgi:lariat debranching enzyme